MLFFSSPVISLILSLVKGLSDTNNKHSIIFFHSEKLFISFLNLKHLLSRQMINAWDKSFILVLEFLRSSWAIENKI